MKHSQQPLVSVIMNCYNGERYLRESIKSVIGQSYQNWELIFWDNQSTDKSTEIFNSYDDKRLIYNYAPNHTLLYEARNFAIEKSHGKFIAFLDVDDWWEVKKLEKQVPLFDDPEVGFVCSNYLIINKEERSQKLFRKKKILDGWVLNNLLLDYPVGMLTLILRRKAFNSLLGGFNPRFHIIGDMDIVVRLSEKWKMACCQESLAYYRLHSENEGKKHKARQVAEFQELLIRLEKNPNITSLKGYKKVVDELAYMQGRLCINNNKRGEAFIYLKNLSWGKYKIKLFICIASNKIWH